MPEECKEKFPHCVYVERNAELSTELARLEQEICKLKEELRNAISTKKDLEELVIKLNMRMYLNY
ncbi:hypothetical protein [uncultured Robinsoniella sp.]|uniref:hypothetical protein n=1 Tax=uncultured Robinsoniella sp. TaxID=904190 RepID=UPI0029127539|nr:hypothetical protein [Clostridiales bacterium]